jgi:hypothetical protein
MFNSGLSSIRSVVTLDVVALFAGFGCDMDTSFTSVFYVHMCVPLVGLVVVTAGYVWVYGGLYTAVTKSKLVHFRHQYLAHHKAVKETDLSPDSSDKEGLDRSDVFYCKPVTFIWYFRCIDHH